MTRTRRARFFGAVLLRGTLLCSTLTGALLVGACGARDTGVDPNRGLGSDSDGDGERDGDGAPILANGGVLPNGGVPDSALPGSALPGSAVPGSPLPGSAGGGAAPPSSSSPGAGSPGAAPSGGPVPSGLTPGAPPVGVGVDPVAPVGGGGGMNPVPGQVTVPPPGQTPDTPPGMVLPGVNDPPAVGEPPPVPSLEPPPEPILPPLDPPPEPVIPGPDPVEPTPDPVEPTPDPVEPEPDLPPLWLAVSGTAAVIIDVNDTDTVLPAADLVYELVDNRPAASADGSLVAKSADGNLVILDLDTDVEVELIGEADVQIITWRPEGLLVRAWESSLYRFDANLANGTLLSDAMPPGAVVVPGISPANTQLVFSTYDSEAQQFPVWWMSLTTGSVPQQVMIATGSPALSHLWTTDEQWVAFGVSQSEGGGTYLWNTTTDPSSVAYLSADNPGYSPYYTFSPDGTKLMTFAGGGIEIMQVAGDRLTFSVPAVGSSPASWSIDGSYIMYSDSAGGHITPIAADGTPGVPLDVDGLSYGCELGWLTPDRLLYRACSGTNTPFMLADITPGDPPTVELTALSTDSLSTVSAAPTTACFANWGPNAVRVGSAAQLTTYATPRSGTNLNLNSLIWAPDSSGVVWLEGLSSRRSVYWQPIDANCAPVGTPVPIVTNSQDVTRVNFLAR